MIHKLKWILFLSIILSLFACSTEVDDVYTNDDVSNQGDKSQQVNTNPIGVTENLIVITLDGLRWQEVFGEEDVLDRNYLSTVGNLYGDRNQGNLVNVANSRWISYPGYHEIFTGIPTGINSNNPIPNPHKTVFEYVHEQPGFGNKNVQVIGMWTRMRELFRVSNVNSTFPVLTPMQLNTENRVIDVIPYFLEQKDDIYSENFTEVKGEYEQMLPTLNRFDGDVEGELLLYLIGRKSLEKIGPRLMYMQFAATDSRAHAGDWDGYIKAAKNNAIFIKDLINFTNTHPSYANKTTILITTDHGRGINSAWKHHGSGIPSSDQTWFVLISPHTNVGVVTESNQYHNEQFAQTMANILGLNYEADHEIAPALDL